MIAPWRRTVLQIFLFVLLGFKFERAEKRFVQLKSNSLSLTVNNQKFEALKMKFLTLIIVSA